MLIQFSKCLDVHICSDEFDRPRIVQCHTCKSKVSNKDVTCLAHSCLMKVEFMSNFSHFFNVIGTLAKQLLKKKNKLKTCFIEKGRLESMRHRKPVPEN